MAKINTLLYKTVNTIVLSRAAAVVVAEKFSFKCSQPSSTSFSRAEIMVMFVLMCEEQQHDAVL